MDEQKQWGLNINSNKTENRTTGLENEDKLAIKNEEIKKVNRFKQLLSVLESGMKN